MSHKRHLHYVWTRIRPVSYWYFLVMAILSGVVFVFAFRQNSLNMIKLRDKVFVADEANGDVETPLKDLRSYVHSHINTDLTPDESSIRPPIQLKHRYERLLQAEKDRTSKSNEQVYKDAQAECERLFPAGLSGRGRIPCIEEYVSAHGIKEHSIPKELYQFDFISPTWSPDLAGWSLVITGVFVLLFLVRLSLEFWIQNRISAHS